MAHLETVTITGADDSVRPVDLVEISVEFPFVEWGILVSGKRYCEPRFPSMPWLWELARFRDAARVQRSMHLCGSYMRGLLVGEDKLDAAAHALLEFCRRVQLNFHGESQVWRAGDMAGLLNSDPWWTKFVICQFDGHDGRRILEALRDEGLYAVFPLFDVSHGAGVLPEKWPEAIYLDYRDHHSLHGYAGGLGPDNLDREIPRILEAAKNAPVWIDMETRVRSPDGHFDIETVKRCLQVCGQYIDA